MAITINHSTCKSCLLCTEVCPNKILVKTELNEIASRPERVDLCFKCGQCMAICPSKSIIIDGFSYERDFFELPVCEQSNLENSFLDLIHTRRAIRNFKDKPVPKALLEKVVEAISFAPPSFPPVKVGIVVVQNTELIQKSLPVMILFYEKFVQIMKSPIIRFFIKREAGVKTYKTIQNHLVPILKVRLPALKNGTEDTLTRHTPAMILFVSDKNGENISQDISIAATYGMLAAHALGLGGSIMDIISPAINKDKDLRKMFGIRDEQEVVTSINIGYPRYKYLRGIKRNLKEVQWI